MPYSTLFIDLDGTVYPHENGMWEEIATRMESYMHDILGISRPQIPALRTSYFQTYGTTLRGLQANYTFDAEEYLRFVHDIPVSSYLKPDPGLKEMLSNLPQSKWILTNSDRNHAQRILEALGLLEQFDGVFGVQEFNFLPKPQPAVFQKALEFTGNPNPRECIFIDDIPHNLTPAHQMGFTTVLVGSKLSNAFTDYHIGKLHDLSGALPELNQATV